MPRKRIKSKKIDSYKSMTLYDSLHCALTWIDIDRINLDWNDTALIRKLWKLHGEKIMEEWRQDPVHAGRRPKIWWHIFTKESDWKILGYEDFVVNSLGVLDGKEIIDGDKPIIEKYTIYEGQTVFLKRLGFLEDWEIKILNDKKGKAQFEKETDSLPY